MPLASGYIAELEQFHPLSVPSETYDTRLSHLASESYRISSELTFIIDNMEMDLDPPILKKAFGGIKYDQAQIEATNWEDYVGKLEKRSAPIISSLGELIRQRRTLEKDDEDLSNLKKAIGALSRFEIDIGKISQLRRFRGEFGIVDSEDLPELERSLPESVVLSVKISDKESAVFAFGSADQADRISKTLRSFDARSLAIPKDFPQNPFLATRDIDLRKEKIRQKVEEIRGKTEDTVHSISDSILGLREAADVAYSVLDELKKSGKLKRVSVVSGYVPSDLVSKLDSKISGRWPMIVQEIDPAKTYAEGMEEAETGEARADEPPTKFNSKNPVVVAHQALTTTSGSPVYGEFDPTPIIAVTFPIFYGLMFGDLGHGALMALFGGLILWRGTRDLKRWGLIFMLGGLSASFWGLFVGEIFGFDLPFNLASLVGLEPLKQALNPLTNPEGLVFNTSTVLFFVKFAIYIGIVDLYIGLFIGLYNKLRARDYPHLWSSVLPTIVGYTFFLILGFAFKGAHFNIAVLTSGNIQATIGLYGLIGSIIWLFAAGPVLVKIHRIHASVASELGASTLEFLEWVVAKFLGNTVSFVRLSVLLIVHAALLAATNLLYFSYGIATLPALIILNALIFLFEGLLVYVQGLRLHLYEFFSKFYLGTGQEFRSITPRRRHLTIKWIEQQQV
jgi:V/A-type H+/Na+-transporting ATPase subunit I